jgi:hypothetical protein
MEDEFKKFDQLIETLSKSYNGQIKFIQSLTLLLETPEKFKYILERVYSDTRSPFRTSYCDFMSNIDNGMDQPEAIELLATEIINRRIKERLYGKYVIF